MDEKIDAQWLAVTLSDAAETLNKAISLIEEDPRRARGVLENEIPALYAKLNYAVNTATVGPDAINTMEHDLLTAWPHGLNFERIIKIVP